MLMANKDKKGTAALIIKKMGKAETAEPVETNEMGDEVDSSMAEDSAAEEVMAAIEAKDAKAFKEAMKSFMEICCSDSDEE